MELKERVKEVVNEAFTKREDLFLTDLKISDGGDIIIEMDGDRGVNVDDCIEISRSIEEVLDGEGYDFSLEVSSCGATSALVDFRQYVKNIGRVLSVERKEGERVEGVLKSVEGGEIVVETESREPKPIGKGKITVKREHKIKIEDIKEARVVIKF